MSKPLLFLFAGQGSQSFHMGREIVERCPAVRERLNALDAVAREALGRSVVEIVYDPGRRRSDSFDRLLHSNPALFILQVALAEALIEQGARPDALLGASLGEIVALTVAGAMTAEQGLRLVVAMSEAFERHGPAGGLLVVLASPDMREARPGLFAGIEVAGVSSDEHFIAAGPAESLARVERQLAAEGRACLLLPVRFAFHSSYLEPTRLFLQPLFAPHEGRALRLPVLSCVTAGALDRLPSGHLWQVVRAPMRLSETYRGLEAGGASLFVDLSPSGTMATVARYNLAPGSGTELRAAMNPFGNDWAAYQGVRERLGLTD